MDRSPLNNSTARTGPLCNDEAQLPRQHEGLACEPTRLSQIASRVFLHYGDLVDGIGLGQTLTHVHADEVHSLGAQPHVRVSYHQPVYTVQATALGMINLLEAIRGTGLSVGFYQASSSEQYGNNFTT